MDLQNFKESIQGTLVTPEDPDYDSLRKVFYGGIDKKPKIIVRVSNVSDIQKTITFAKENNLDLAIRSGGHSTLGFCVVDDGVVIDLRDMKKVEVDTENKTVWAESGLTASELTNELDKYNFVLGFGDTGSVGIGGITLGGGNGYLVRKYGMTIDNLLAAEIVLADGKVVQVDKDNYPDLFWALRGGGGNFGVVTKFKYKLHELHECYGGMMLLPATPDVIVGCMEIAQNAPDELSAIFNIMPTPPMPFVPSDQHSKLSIMALFMYAGNSQEGEKALAPIRALAKPIADLVKPMRYKNIFFPENEEYHPLAVSKTFHMNSIDHELAEKIIAHLNAIQAPMKALQLRILGGAVNRVPTDDTAYGHRSSKIMGNVAAFYETESEKHERLQWVDEFVKLLDQGDRAVYVNFLSESDKDRSKDAYTEKTWKKLIEIKRKYDPENFFHHNINISPKA